MTWPDAPVPQSWTTTSTAEFVSHPHTPATPERPHMGLGHCYEHDWHIFPCSMSSPIYTSAASSSTYVHTTIRLVLEQPLVKRLPLGQMTTVPHLPHNNHEYQYPHGVVGQGGTTGRPSPSPLHPESGASPFLSPQAT